MLNTSTILDDAIANHMAVTRSLSAQRATLESIAADTTRAVPAGNDIFWCGNGGSAADVWHFRAELVGRRERPGMASVAITPDTSILTAIGNDWGFDKLRCHQIEALCRRDDEVVGITTSGNSGNLCAAELGAVNIAFTGQDGGMAENADIALAYKPPIPRASRKPIFSGHILCDRIEACFLEKRLTLPEMKKS